MPLSNAQRQRSSSRPKKGNRVRIERDEVAYPAKGTWRRYAGRIGTVVGTNLCGGSPNSSEPCQTPSIHDEFLVNLSPSGNGSGGVWFRTSELTVV